MKVPKPRKLKCGTWFIQLRLDGESIPITAASEKECIRQATLLKAEKIATGKATKTDKKSMTVGHAIDQYIARRDSILSPATIRGYRILRENRFQSMMGKNIYSVTQKEWQTACNLEAKNPKCSAKTLKNAWGLVSSVISETTGQPAPKVTLPQIVPNERPFLDPDQVKKFISLVHGTDVEIPALLALSSLRRSEILALTWENVDLTRKMIKVQGAVVPDENNKMIYKAENKNKTSNRIVPIMIGELFSALQDAKRDSGAVVTGNPLTIWKKINRICKSAGLPEVGIHGLRHSFASLAYHLQVPEKIVMEIGGWSDNQTMRKIYTHIAKSDLERYSKEFENFYAGSKNANQNANQIENTSNS